MIMQHKLVHLIRQFSKLPHIDFQPQPYKNVNYNKIKSIRKTVLSPAMFHYYTEPLLIHQGHKQWLFDHHNKRYLDLFGGIVTVCLGHCHPRTNAALQKQSEKLWHTTNIYMHPEVHEYAEMLVDRLPEPLKVVYFVNSGSEANDMAFLMAKLSTGRNEILTLRNSYHGMSAFSMGATNLSTWRFPVSTHSGFVPIMNPDPYKGPWGGRNCRDSLVQPNRECSCVGHSCVACDKYIDQLKDVINHSTPKAGVAGFIAESIQGVGGAVQFPRNFLQKAYEVVRERGGLCIADEVQTGFGRLGDHYWGFQSHGVLPDIVTMAKSIGNGFPLAAVVTTRKVAESLSSALTLNTFGGNPLACAVGKEVLKIIDEENLMDNCRVVGARLLMGLEGLRHKHAEIGDVRGKGLMIGVEMVQGVGDRTPLGPARMSALMDALKDAGLLVGKGGFSGNVFRIKPPMCITNDDVDFAIDVFDECLSRP